MKKITIEQYLDQKKNTFEQIIEDFGSWHMTIEDLTKVFLDQNRQLELDETKCIKVLIEIELLFDAVPDTKFKSLFTNNFIELSRLDGNGFNSWQNGIEFNEKIEDDLKISYKCGLHDLEIMQLICNKLNECPPDKKEFILAFIQRYLNIIKIYFIKTLQIILYAMMLTAPSRTLEMKYLYKNGNETKIRVKTYRDISKLRLNKKLALLQNMPPYYEFSKISKLCNKDFRKRIADQSFNLENARELSEYILILLECFYYFSMKCYLKSKRTHATGNYKKSPTILP